MFDRSLLYFLSVLFSSLDFHGKSIAQSSCPASPLRHIQGNSIDEKLCNRLDWSFINVNFKRSISEALTVLPLYGAQKFTKTKRASVVYSMVASVTWFINVTSDKTPAHFREVRRKDVSSENRAMINEDD